MYPHERSLVKKMEGRPFVLLGVNSDPRERLRDTIKRERMSWRSWWDGGSPGGPIASAWGVEGWPTLCVIDAKGILRERFLGSPGGAVLDTAIEKLVAEAEKEKNR